VPATASAAFVEGLPAEVVMADKAYDADHLRQAIAAKGALAVIPNNPSRALKYPFDKHLYAQRHLVECFQSSSSSPASRSASKRPPEFIGRSLLSQPCLSG
jgi:transposase